MANSQSVSRQVRPVGPAGLCVGMLAALLVGLLAGCGGGGRDGSQSTLPSPYRIVTTVAMLTDVVETIAGEHAEVTGLMGPGIDPHLYKPSAYDLSQLQRAHLVMYVGLLLEGRMADDLAHLGERGKPIFAVAETLPKEYLRSPEEFEGHHDPHVWMDVSAWSQVAQEVGDRLAEFDPAHAEDYRANTAAYREKLALLDQYVREVIASIPKEQRHLVTAHDAFGYFSRAYEIPVHSVQGITTDSEPGVNDINRLVQFLSETKVPAVFVESSVPRKNLEAVLEGTARKGVPVKIGGELYSDAMGASGTWEGTYIGMLDHNATLIARELGGESPDGGFREWLEQRERDPGE